MSETMSETKKTWCSDEIIGMQLHETTGRLFLLAKNRVYEFYGDMWHPMVFDEPYTVIATSGSMAFYPGMIVRK